MPDVARNMFHAKIVSTNILKLIVNCKRFFYSNIGSEKSPFLNLLKAKVNENKKLFGDGWCVFRIQ